MSLLVFSYRCPSKHANYRCHKHRGHSGLHSAPAGTRQVQWPS